MYTYLLEIYAGSLLTGTSAIGRSVYIQGFGYTRDIHSGISSRLTFPSLLYVPSDSVCLSDRLKGRRRRCYEGSGHFDFSSPERDTERWPITKQFCYNFITGSFFAWKPLWKPCWRHFAWFFEMNRNNVWTFHRPNDLNDRQHEDSYAHGVRPNLSN